MSVVREVVATHSSSAALRRVLWCPESWCVRIKQSQNPLVSHYDHIKPSNQHVWRFYNTSFTHRHGHSHGCVDWRKEIQTCTDQVFIRGHTLRVTRYKTESTRETDVFICSALGGFFVCQSSRETCSGLWGRLWKGWQGLGLMNGCINMGSVMRMKGGAGDMRDALVTWGDGMGGALCVNGDRKTGLPQGSVWKKTLHSNSSMRPVQFNAFISFLSST